MKLSIEQLERVKKAELSIFRLFIQACEALGLKYYIVYGTLLGAVRHKGFIPWDDDIDVAMPREDYEIFAKEGQKYLPSHLFVQNHHSDKGYVNGFMKIRNTETTFIEIATQNQKINHGVFIDIFPLDNYDIDLKTLKWVHFKDRFYLERLREELFRPEIPLVSKILEPILRRIYPSTGGTVEKREKLYQSMQGGKYWANACGCWGHDEIVAVPIEWYGEGTTVEFEGIPVTAPKEYEKWLTQEYGDYMQLPPVEARFSHHYATVIDLENSYKLYIKDNL